MLSDELKMSLYPPFLLMRARFTKIDSNWRKVIVTLPLNGLSRNAGEFLQNTTHRHTDSQSAGDR